MIPDFVCVGPGRSGTTWLYEVLLAHPQIQLAEGIKETDFFNNNFEKGYEWYKKFFPYMSDSLQTGEISNTYINHPDVPDHIAKYNSSCKIIICIRNPVDRIKSFYGFRVRTGLLRDPLAKVIKESPEFLERGLIYDKAKVYLSKFGKKNVFFVDFEKVKNDPTVLCRDLYSALGVQNDFFPKVGKKQVNKAIEPRFWIFGRMARKLAYFLRRHEIFGLLTFLKRSDFLKGLFFKDLDKKKLTITEEDELYLRDYYKKEWTNLQKLLGS